MESLQVTKIESASALEALNRSEIDIQIATAKQWPRDVQASINRVTALATVNPTTASECFYSLRRKGGSGADSVIEGPSVRLAEIVATSWGNLRVASQIVGNDGKFITARGVCHDLETNVAIASEVKRRITDKYGKTFNEDMQVVTGNAAGAIAFRNAVFKVVPKAVISEAITAIREKISESVAGDNFEETKKKALAYYASQGVTKDMILSYFELESDEDLTPDVIAELRTTTTAVNEGQATYKDLFIKPWEEKMAAKQAKAKSASAKDMVEAAMAKQNKDSVFDDLPA